ncbi:MAG: (deoxy)nucleoside triphosphate pyrophosphohydrolase [Burkholderiales bacterium]|nr:(deoxy)nucleoside triphosphate pyrophosphohydrolase [Burkholderiales bacterium]
MEQVVIRAVAGVLKKDSWVLMASRPVGKSHAGSWEFPGGKLENGETAITALIRELHEEIGVIVDARHCNYLTFIQQDYSHTKVELDVVVVSHWTGEIVAVENQELSWQDLTKPCMISPLLPTTKKILNLLASSKLY